MLRSSITSFNCLRGKQCFPRVVDTEVTFAWNPQGILWEELWGDSQWREGTALWSHGGRDSHCRLCEEHPREVFEEDSSSDLHPSHLFCFRIIGKERRGTVETGNIFLKNLDIHSPKQNDLLVKLWNGGHYHHPLGTLATPSTGPQHPKGGKPSQAFSKWGSQSWELGWLFEGRLTCKDDARFSLIHSPSTWVSLYHRRITHSYIWWG